MDTKKTEGADVMTHLGRYYKLIAYPGKEEQAAPCKSAKTNEPEIPPFDASPERQAMRVMAVAELSGQSISYENALALCLADADRKQKQDEETNALKEKYAPADLDQPVDWWSIPERCDMLAAMRFALEHPQEARQALAMSEEPGCLLPLLTSARLLVMADALQRHHEGETTIKVYTVEDHIRVELDLTDPDEW